MTKSRSQTKRPPPNPRAAALKRLGRWLTGKRQEIRQQVRLRQGRREGEGRTSIEIDHRLEARDAGLGKLHIRTQKSHLPSAHFSSEARICISNAASSDSGRVIYCLDDDEVIAVLAFHIGRRKSHPILITAIALRQDVEFNPNLANRTVEAALVLKHYVHAVSAELGRGGAVDIDLADSRQMELMAELGFRKAPRLAGFRPGGTHLRQQAPA
jgi:hypothetical protein